MRVWVRDSTRESISGGSRMAGSGRGRGGGLVLEPEGRVLELEVDGEKREGRMEGK